MTTFNRSFLPGLSLWLALTASAATGAIPGRGAVRCGSLQ